ncbi:MAG TPA: hypothetical protein PK156_11345 [Polyangium sp.]|nr:hypothetical protein [Polyangium sp.]
MTRLFPSLAIAVALCTTAWTANADPVTSSSPLMAVSKRCTPGAQVSCNCGDGAAGTSTCNSSGVGFSVCACAKVTVNVPKPVIPVVVVPKVRVRPVHVRKHKSEPIPGLALLIGGACALGTGAFNVAFGVDRIRDYGTDPFGIVSVSLGGTAMLAGLPITIVGIVRYATEPKEVEKDGKEKTGIRFMPTANGFALHF